MSLDHKIAKALSSSLTILFEKVSPGSLNGISTFGLSTRWDRQARDEYGDHMIEWLVYSTSDVKPTVLIGWIRLGGVTVVPNVRQPLGSARSDQALLRKVFS
jgi:hypothetical protein